MLTVGNYKASEVLDSVFALLSLTKTNDLTLQPDYNLTAAQVFSAAARIGLRSGRLFDMLCLACRNPESALKRSLPSWVPDFSDPERIGYQLQSTCRLQSSDGVFSAGGKTGSMFWVSKNGLVLRLKGKIIDVIAVLLTGPLRPPRSSWDDTKQWFKKCQTLVSENSQSPSTEQLSSFWWRLAICDVHITDRDEFSRASSGFDSFYLEQKVTEQFSSDELPVFLLPSTPLHQKQWEYCRTILRYSAKMALCRTEKRYLGWATPYTQSVDKICLLEGSSAPWVIRPKSDGTFQLVGEAYVHGIMDGKAIEREGTQWEHIKLS